MNKIRIFLVDDDAMFLKSLENMFSESKEFEIFPYSSGNDCLLNLSKNPDVVILDYNLSTVDKGSSNGLTTLRKIKEQSPGAQVIMLSSQDKMEVAVSCMKNGAYDYIVKNETAFVRLKIAVKNIFSNAGGKQIQHWDW